MQKSLKNKGRRKWDLVWEKAVSSVHWAKSGLSDVALQNLTSTRNFQKTQTTAAWSNRTDDIVNINNHQANLPHSFYLLILLICQL